MFNYLSLIFVKSNSTHVLAFLGFSSANYYTSRCHVAWCITKNKILEKYFLNQHSSVELNKLVLKIITNYNILYTNYNILLYIPWIIFFITICWRKDARWIWIGYAQQLMWCWFVIYEHKVYIWSTWNINRNWLKKIDPSNNAN